MSARGIHRWLKLDSAERQEIILDFYKSNNPEIRRDLLSLVRAASGYGVYASIGPNYQFAVFGRDSIAVGEDLLTIQPHLTKEIILLLARLQGQHFNLVNEEEPGKIHHEYRAMHFKDHDIPLAAKKVLDALKTKWGGTSDELLYYGSYDATPLFIRLVHRYCQAHGPELLGNPVMGRDGTERPLRDHVRLATDWLVEKINASPWQLFEYKRLNPVGLYNQSWQDSNVAYIHKDGTLAHADNGVASIELQGYAYDALRAAAEIVAANEEEINAWRHLASIVRDNALNLLWMKNERYFASGLDRNDNGLTRQIDTFNINAGLLLETDLLSLLPHHQAWPYIEGIIQRLFSNDFVTPAGLRVRGLRHASLVNFADYHGSMVSWPKATYDVAKGLRRHGFYALAHLLENSILQSVGQAGEFYEFFFVNVKGTPKYHYRHENPIEPTFHEFGAANLPDPGQAWTVAAVLSIIDHRHNPATRLPVLDSVQELEAKILENPDLRELRQSLIRPVAIRAASGGSPQKTSRHAKASEGRAD